MREKKYRAVTYSVSKASDERKPVITISNAHIGSVGSNFSHGANFATAGSIVRLQDTAKAAKWMESHFIRRSICSIFNKKIPDAVKEYEYSKPSYKVLSNNVTQEGFWDFADKGRLFSQSLSINYKLINEIFA
ncbi:unnamed protein product [Dovyalis caffra]|uniref:Uncharacterized protein n=1 Tax=Dovyalis caffra TaxID=77055 RepID=A0AAV1R5B4_9ROSI|nr:unnamed protein product [Dovyalis caffra]